MFPHFSFSSFDQSELSYLGAERFPLMVIDNFIDQPELLLANASSGEDFKASPSDYYPGVRKAVSGNYAEALCFALQQVFQQNFDLAASRDPSVSLCAFSMTTTAPEQLRPIQSLPHFDNSDPLQLAVVHYLCGAEFGGTSFYRHRQTGFESIGPDRVQSYAKKLKAEVMAARFVGKTYMNGDDSWFERIGGVQAKFNRAVIFRGNLLHSGDIDARKNLSSKPLEGRLTANTFIHFSAPKAPL